MKKIGKLIDILEWTCMAGSVAGLLLIMVLTTVDVFMRKFTAYSVPSLFEMVSDYLMVALVFLAISRVYRLGGHVRVTLLERALPHTGRQILQRVMDAVAFLFFLLMAVMGWESARSAMIFQEVSSSVLAYPLAPAFFIVPVGAGLACLRSLQALVFGSVHGR
ncbi:MAG: TRAP transporter small permease [Desulfobacterales bacterium]|nr:TRAP transporter small permease [Desulfobacterales bacterium]